MNQRGGGGCSDSGYACRRNELVRRSVAAERDAVLGAKWFAGTWRRNEDVGRRTMRHDQDESAYKYKLSGCVDRFIVTMLSASSAA